MKERQLQAMWRLRSWQEVSAEMERRGDPCSPANCERYHRQAMRKLRSHPLPQLEEMLIDLSEPTKGVRAHSPSVKGEDGLIHLGLTEVGLR